MPRAARTQMAYVVARISRCLDVNACEDVRLSPMATQKFWYGNQKGADPSNTVAIRTTGGMCAAVVTSTTARNSTEIAMKLDGSIKRSANIANAITTDSTRMLDVS